MSEISRRSLTKFTYDPIRPGPDDESDQKLVRRGLEKVAYASALKARPEEIQAAKATAARGDPDVILALDAIEQATSRATARTGWHALGLIPATDLVAAGRALAEHRRAQRGELRTLAEALVDDHAEDVRKTLEPPVVSPPPASTSAASLVAVPPNPWKPDAATDARLGGAALKPNVSAAIEWARVRDPVRIDGLVSLAQSVSVAGPGFGRLKDFDADRFSATLLAQLDDAPDWTDDLTDGFEERMKVEPIGRLHLERIDMTPVGVVRGELVHSVGLAPLESVTLIHREWSSREVSFEKVVTEEFEQTAEEGVTENTELASATETQSRHGSAFSMQATASGSFGFASASGSVGYNSTSDNEVTKRDSRNHSIEVTRKAASRTRKEHKTTFTIKQRAGVEDESIRTLTNPSQTEPMRVDLHQLVRDWQVELYRYGLRLTYDIVVPAPGIDLLANVDELRRVDHQLAQSFSFSLTPSQITRANWSELASRYAAEVEPPPPEMLLLNRAFAFPLQSDEEAEAHRFDTLEFEIPAGYKVRQGDFQGWVTMHPAGHFEVMDGSGPIGHNGPEVRSYHSSLLPFQGRSGTVVIVMASNGLEAGHVQATFEAAQTIEGWQAWQNQAWTAMSRAAEQLWQAQRQDLQQRRDRLNADLANWDPLTLRRMEREEVMKTTLKWIFGPAFDLMPSEVTRLYGGGADGGLATLEPSGLSVEQWAQAMGLGEFIKFIHQAIEWENVLYFVYPYFWDNPRNHALKRFLQHPDSLHQAFLRGGAARVVLTVRPGFEESFTRLFETGSLDEELKDHPYLTIAQEIRAFAETHYPGIPGADGATIPEDEEVAAAERGELVARWHEFTPISALDLTINTPLADLK